MNVSPAQSSTKKRRCHDSRRKPDLEQLPPRGPVLPGDTLHSKQWRAVHVPRLALCSLQPGSWRPPSPDRLNKRKKACDLLFHRVARRANNKPLLSYLLPIPTWPSSQPTPSPMTPFPCSDPGPRSRIPLAHFIPAFAIESMHASFHYSASLPKPGLGLLFSPQTPGMVQHQTNVPEPFSRHPETPSRSPPSTPHGGDHHDPHDPKDAIISIAGPGTPPRRPGRPAKTLTIQLTSPRSSHLIECGIGPG